MLDFLTAMFGNRLIEITAVLLGIANITLLMRRSIWNYPFGIAMVSLYAFIFYEAKLYSDMGLQGFFFVIQIYGWWYWYRGMSEDGQIKVRLLAPGTYPVYLLVAIFGVIALGTGMARLTDAALPYWDATTTVLSVIAQFLLARRRLENWIVWILVDVIAIGIYFAKGLYPTMVLYAIFLVMASGGLGLWWRAYRDQGSHT